MICGKRMESRKYLINIVDEDEDEDEDDRHGEKKNLKHKPSFFLPLILPSFKRILILSIKFYFQ